MTTEDAPWSTPLDAETIDAAVAKANLPTLLMVLFQLTGDERWLAPPYLPHSSTGVEEDDTGGLDPGHQRTIVKAAGEALLAWSSGTPPACPKPRGALLLRMMRACVGEDVPPSYVPMMEAEFGFADEPQDVHGGPGRYDGMRVAVIGAGIGGLTVAHELKRRGVAFTVFERNDDVGGVWLVNRYPGAGVDTPSFLYSWSFYPKLWTQYFAKRDEVIGYLRDMCDHFGLRSHIQLSTAVHACSFDGATGRWRLEIERDGVRREEMYDAVVSAVGVFGEPRLPRLEGLTGFDGPVFHSSLWPRGFGVDGKRVAIVGTGASAMQIAPAIAAQAAEIAIYQRSAQWIAPARKYFQQVAPEVHWLMANAPHYGKWYRFRQIWAFGDRRHPHLQIDPDWMGHPCSINAANDELRVALERYRQHRVADPDLFVRTAPDHPPYGKRLLLDNGWFTTLQRSNVRLFSEPAERVVGNDIVSASGVRWSADVIVICTGFEATRYISSVDVTGRSGTKLADAWRGDDARAHLGVMVPDFPNFFMIYGPNTNSGGGSFFSLAESQARYILRMLSEAKIRGMRAVEPTPDAFSRYNAAVDEAHSHMIWTARGLRSYYRNESGRVVVNMPWRGVDYWAMLAHPEGFEYRFDAI